MTREGVTFLTKKDFDVKSLIIILKEQSKLIEKTEDQKILKQILMLFEKNNLTLLSPQEVHFLESNKQEIWAEYLIFRYKMNYFPKQKIVYDFPVYLLIEPVSACNLRCIMCFQIDETFTSNNKFMGMIDFELFKKIIDDAVAGGTKAITLASRGEPTLHPKLGEMLEYCSGKFFATSFARKIFFAKEDKYLLARPNTILFSYIINGKLKSLDVKEIGKDT